MNEQLLDNPKVGEILKEEFLEEIGMSQNALAKAISVPSNLAGRQRQLESREDKHHSFLTSLVKLTFIG